MSKFNDGMRSSATPEWSTPDDVFAEINRIYGPFTLDPCATAENAKAEKFYTVEDNGLRQDWSGERVFMNPPYGRSIQCWIEKAATSNAYVVCLIPARTDTKWWHQYIGDGHKWLADEVHFWRGRIKFSGAEHNAPFPSVLVVFSKIEYVQIGEVREGEIHRAQLASRLERERLL